MRGKPTLTGRETSESIAESQTIAEQEQTVIEAGGTLDQEAKPEPEPPKNGGRKTMAKAKQQQELPGMEEREIPELEDKGYEYLKARNKRQDILKKEVELKGDLLSLMKKHKKHDYVRDGIEIHVVAESETVKVRVRKEGESEEEEEQE